MAEFLHMGGYAFYVWMSFGISALVLLINFLQPLFKHRQALREAEDYYSETQ